MLAFIPCLPSGGSEAIENAELKIGGATLSIDFEGAATPALRRLLLDWTRRAAQAVTLYYGTFPVRAVQIHLHVGPGSGIGSGRAEGENGARIDVEAGEDTTADDISEGGHGWIMTHEMVHLALPSVAPEHHWIEEGLATYVEPVARVRSGELTAGRIWQDMIEQMPQGQPEPGDRGLDRTPTWGRTYWGGAMFCLLADVEIREATHNRAGLETALRGVLHAGGSIEQDWPLERVLKEGDRALGIPVLRPLYEKMKFEQTPVDLDTLWKQLGVSVRDGEIHLQDDAPEAAIRRRITQP